MATAFWRWTLCEEAKAVIHLNAIPKSSFETQVSGSYRLKKTGLPSQGMTRKPGEFSESVQLRFRGNSRMRLYQATFEIFYIQRTNPAQRPSYQSAKPVLPILQN